MAINIEKELENVTGGAPYANGSFAENGNAIVYTVAGRYPDRDRLPLRRQLHGHCQVEPYAGPEYAQSRPAAYHLSQCDPVRAA